MRTQVQYDRQKRRAKRRSVKATKIKKHLRKTGAIIRRVLDEKVRTLWHPENW